MLSTPPVHEPVPAGRRSMSTTTSPSIPLSTRLYKCECGKPVFFGNSLCLNCKRPLGFEPSLGRVISLQETETGTFELVAANDGAAFKRCANAKPPCSCNWLIPVAEVEAGIQFCRSCRLNRTIPNLTTATNAEYWAAIELAKRRLVSGLLALGLPVKSKVSEDPNCGVAFDFLESFAFGPSVRTGHDDGVITLNIEEANDSNRENIRSKMHEPYRTLLGHLRHESGHYYWDRLVRDGPFLNAFREMFGDDRQDYCAALEKHYSQGPPSDWPVTFVSAYASAHPWEDWAETWAHYLHMHDTLETAEGFHLNMSYVEMPLDEFPSSMLVESDPAFLDQLNSWMRFSAVLNEFARSMGQPDFYPFVLSTASVRKLHFVHRVIGSQVSLSSSASIQAQTR